MERTGLLRRGAPAPSLTWPRPRRLASALAPARVIVSLSDRDSWHNVLGGAQGRIGTRHPPVTAWVPSIWTPGIEAARPVSGRLGAAAPTISGALSGYRRVKRLKRERQPMTTFDKREEASRLSSRMTRSSISWPSRAATSSRCLGGGLWTKGAERSLRGDPDRARFPGRDERSHRHQGRRRSQGDGIERSPQDTRQMMDPGEGRHGNRSRTLRLWV